MLIYSKWGLKSRFLEFFQHNLSCNMSIYMFFGSYITKMTLSWGFRARVAFYVVFLLIFACYVAIFVVFDAYIALL